MTMTSSADQRLHYLVDALCHTLYEADKLYSLIKFFNIQFKDVNCMAWLMRMIGIVWRCKIGERTFFIAAPHVHLISTKLKVLHLITNFTRYLNVSLLHVAHKKDLRAWFSPHQRCTGTHISANHSSAAGSSASCHVSFMSVGCVWWCQADNDRVIPPRNYCTEHTRITGVQCNQTLSTEQSRLVAARCSCILLNFFHPWMAVQCGGVNKTSSSMKISYRLETTIYWLTVLTSLIQSTTNHVSGRQADVPVCMLCQACHKEETALEWF